MGANLAVIGIVVEDMARSLAFYRRLGLDIPAEADSEPHVEAAARRSASWPWTPPRPSAASTPRGGRRPGAAVGAGVRLRLARRRGRIYGELVAAGYQGHKEPWDAFWGMRYALVHDPDGNGVDLFCPTTT